MFGERYLEPHSQCRSCNITSMAAWFHFEHTMNNVEDGMAVLRMDAGLCLLIVMYRGPIEVRIQQPGFVGFTRNLTAAHM